MKKLSFRLFVFTLLLIICSCQNQVKSTKTLNVLFIAVDDLRPNIGCYGDDKAITPNLDQLAKRGMIFNNAYCQQAVCNPSRASVMTGLRPDQIRVTNLGSHFRQTVPDVLTLPQAFKAKGYEAVAIGKIFHGSKKTQDEVSWSEPSVMNLSKKSDEYALLENQTGKKAAAYEMADVADSVYEDGQIAINAINQLHKFKESGNPFFLAVGFKKPHLPFCAPKKYWDIYDDSVFESLTEIERPENAPEIAFHNSQELRGYTDIPIEGRIDDIKKQNLWHGYYACISFVDEQLGKILHTLRELDLEDNTVIVLWGDHGYHLGEQALWCKSTNFELDCRIPLFFSFPGMKTAGSGSNALVEAIDIYPTLLDLCGLESHGTLNGKSLLPVLNNPEDSVKDFAFSQFIRPYGALTSMPVSYNGYSVRNKDWRCTVWYNFNNDSIDYSELYDLHDSSIEMKNVAGEPQYAEIEAQLVQLLNDYKSQKYSLIEKR